MINMMNAFSKPTQASPAATPATTPATALAINEVEEKEEEEEPEAPPAKKRKVEEKAEEDESETEEEEQPTVQQQVSDLSQKPQSRKTKRKAKKQANKKTATKQIATKNIVTEHEMVETESQEEVVEPAQPVEVHQTNQRHSLKKKSNAATISVAETTQKLILAEPVAPAVNNEAVKEANEEVEPEITSTEHVDVVETASPAAPVKQNKGRKNRGKGKAKGQQRQPKMKQ